MPVSPDRPVVAPLRQPGMWPPRFPATPEDREALLALAHLESVTPRELHALVAREGSAAGCRAAILAGRAGTAGDRTRIAEVDLSAVRRALDRAHARMVAPRDPEYPPAVLDLPDPPACLFIQGKPLPAMPPAVAIVGARSCSPYGRETAAALGATLAAAGVVVISGAARGIDGAAHRGALGAGGPTVAVLGSGIDRPYPRSNRGLIREIAAHGTVLTEYPPGTEAAPRRFPARNRIVAALARAVIVVEGAAGSGSLITAEFAGDLGREVLAVPGPVTSPLSEAPHALIRDGASLIRGADDVMEALGLERDSADATESGPAAAPGALEPAERRVLACLAGTPATLDDVAAGAQLEPSAVLSALVGLELRGLVRMAGGRYERTRRAGPKVPGRKRPPRGESLTREPASP